MGRFHRTHLVRPARDVRAPASRRPRWLPATGSRLTSGVACEPARSPVLACGRMITLAADERLETGEVYHLEHRVQSDSGRPVWLW